MDNAHVPLFQESCPIEIGRKLNQIVLIRACQNTHRHFLSFDEDPGTSLLNSGAKEKGMKKRGKPCERSNHLETGVVVWMLSMAINEGEEGE